MYRFRAGATWQAKRNARQEIHHALTQERRRCLLWRNHAAFALRCGDDCGASSAQSCLLVVLLIKDYQ
jgi:hypothetical protein